MFRLYLTRHGETKGNVDGTIEGVTDGPLTAKGLQQTKYLAKALKNVKLDAIYCSDLDRSAQTALAIAKYHPKTRVVRTRLVRETYYGKHEGKPFQGFLEKYQHYFRTHRVNGMESGGQLRNRAKRFLHFLRDKYPNGTVLVVGHIVFNNALLATLANTSLHHPWFWQANASISVLEYHERYKGTRQPIWMVDKLNDTSHLPKRLYGHGI